MRILIDNEIENFRKIVCIKSPYNITLDDDLNTIIDALKACSYTEKDIQKAFVQKLRDWHMLISLDKKEE